MAYLHRLIFCVLVALSVWLPASSYASFPGTGGGTGTTYRGDGSMCAVDYAGACALIGGVLGAAPNYYCSANYSHYGCTLPTTCPANATVSGTTCTCAAGYTQQGTGSTATCASNAALAKAVCDGLNSAGIPLTVQATSSAGLNTCFGGYVVKATGAAFGVLNGVSGPGEFYGPFSCSGNTCAGTGASAGSSSDPPPGAQEPNASQCKPTEYWGFVNGLGRCIKAANTSFGGVNKAAPTPAGSTAAPTSGLGSDAPPSATGSTKETTCSGGTCTTTTKYTTATGTDAGTATETKPQATFCQDNPASTVCVQSGLGSSGCGSADACTGDAIQCAIEAQAKATACALTTAPTGDVNINAFNTAAAQSQGDQTGSLTSSINLGPSAFDQTNILGAAVGVADVTIAMPFGHSATLPLSQVNVWLQRLGWVLQGVTFLLCARIVARG